MKPASNSKEISMGKEELLQIFLAIFAFGCLWGFLEAVTFLGVLHSYWGALFKYHLCPCFLMAAVFGSFVLGIALPVYKKPSILMAIGIVAAFYCWLGVPFLPTPVRSTHYAPIIASATAAITAAFSLAFVTAFLMKRLERNVFIRIGVGALSGILASTLFILATAYGVDKPICADLGYCRPLPDFLYIGGMVWMVTQAILFPIGYLVGDKLVSWMVFAFKRRPSLSYAGFAAIIALCLGSGAVSFMIGF